MASGLDIMRSVITAPPLGLDFEKRFLAAAETVPAAGWQRSSIWICHAPIP